MSGVLDLEELSGRLSSRIEEALAPFAPAQERLVTIPGVNQRVAEAVRAEIGANMDQFPSADHLASWAGMCSGNNASAGKRRSGKTTKGSPWLRTTLVQVAWAASHAKGTIFQTMYRRWAKRMGKQKALVAVAHKILVLIHKLLRDQVDYHERQAAPQAA